MADDEAFTFVALAADLCFQGLVGRLTLGAQLQAYDGPDDPYRDDHRRPAGSRRAYFDLMGPNQRDVRDGLGKRTGNGTGNGTGSRPAAAGGTLAEFYAELEIDPNITDQEVTKAYRRQMSRHHPDKLVANGLPESMAQVAKEKTQRIQEAYEGIRAARGMR